MTREQFANDNESMRRVRLGIDLKREFHVRDGVSWAMVSVQELADNPTRLDRLVELLAKHGFVARRKPPLPTPKAYHPRVNAPPFQREPDEDGVLLPRSRSPRVFSA